MIGEPQPWVQTCNGFCIYINTLCQGPIPVERDENGKPVVYATQEEAEREIASDCIERLRQFLEGEREFGDAITVEEYVVPVTAFSDGSITDEDGNVFPSSRW
jgi:hemolysin-activating ACP:hemolysin acyltransferase